MTGGERQVLIMDEHLLLPSQRGNKVRGESHVSLKEEDAFYKRVERLQIREKEVSGL